MTAVPLIETFSYEVLDAETRRFAEAKAHEIHTLVRGSAKRLIAIGRKLREVKERLPWGMFRQWCDQEFGWDNSYTTRLMQVAEKFGALDIGDGQAHTTALQFLSQQNVPEAVRAEAITVIQSGEPLTLDRARDILRPHDPQLADRNLTRTQHAQRQAEQPAYIPPVQRIMRHEETAEERLEAVRIAFLNLRQALIAAYGVPLGVPAPVRRAFSALDLLLLEHEQENLWEDAP